jgi:hypothetical protein
VNVDRWAQQLGQRPEQVDDAFRVGDDVRRIHAVILTEGESIAAGAKSPPDRRLGLLPTK